MAVRKPLLEQTVINANSSVTSDSVELDEEKTLSLQIQGDSDSINLDFEIQVKADPLDQWARLDKLSSQNLTNAVNNSKVYQYDILDLEKLRVKSTNNLSTVTEIKIISQHTAK